MRIDRMVQVAVVAALLGGCVSRQDEPGDRTIEGTADTLVLAEVARPTQMPAAAPAVTASIEADAEPVASQGRMTPTEEITVVGHSFSGLWKVNSPKRLGMDVGIFSGVHIRYSGETGDRDICELRQSGTALDARCLRLSHSAAGSIDGDQITLRAWVGPANLILKASAQSGTSLRGTVSGGALGAQMTGGIPIQATKLSIASDAPERPSAALLRAVLADVAEGRLTAGRYAPEAAERLRRDLGDLRRDQGRLGPVQSMTYLDQLLPRHPYAPDERPLEVYRVGFAQGTQLCGISPGPPAAIADVICR
ncbi:MAG TPA: hypothetical protein VGV37_16605 [Aliidongia sp.]|uniref:hypothetical protein n=1 Tax=Aliidongia sp. TaxID=1914230 RepID=UPI002DDD86D7|nr:hypothetical protein [Aliidongia sp.]HEV2676147.1 hypothetical protein [Aliidongia sp.]